jgi:hypothetical protein
VSCDVARGPFTNSRDWLAAQLQLLMALISLLLPEDEQEQFVLHHNDFNQGNILVDSNDELSDILDWECVHTVPHWYACQMPKFLDAELDWSACLDPDKFSHKTLEDGTVDFNETYVHHLEDYENQCLREFFLKEMGRQCPEWVKWYYQGKLKAGLEDCVATFGMPMSSRDIDLWLDNMETKGKSRSLLEVHRVAKHHLNDPYGYRSPNSDDEWESASESESEQLA